MKNLYRTVLAALLILGSFNLFAQVPVYNSYPAASAVLFLDFDGHTVNGTSWNTSGPIVCGPSNLTNDQITEIYNRIAEDYRPFNINITTDSTKYAAAPVTKRMRVLFTISNSWYGSGAGGVAYIGSFTWGDNTPCFIFTALLNYNTKYLSEAGAHEAGHTLGLRHQSAYDANCVKTSEYHYGIGDGEISWAPIMGVGYYKNNTTWNNGPNPYGCNSLQSDADIIANTTNGFGYRTDDIGETFTSAATKTFSNNTFSATATIGNATDKDMFKFTLASRQQVKMNANPTSFGAVGAGSNLDMQVQLFNGNKVLINSFNPPLTLNAVIDTTLDAGTYYFAVEGVGNVYTPDYGSLGSYAVEVQQIALPGSEGGSGGGTVLPVYSATLNGYAQNGVYLFDWAIQADEPIVSQVLEVSSNSKPFQPVATLGGDVRTYQYSPGGNTSLQYRLKVNVANQSYYSNIISIAKPASGKRMLLSNAIAANEMTVSSPANYNYVITDFSGRLIQKGVTTQGTSIISIGSLNRGSYIIQFTNGQESLIEKFVKQ